MCTHTGIVIVISTLVNAGRKCIMEPELFPHNHAWVQNHKQRASASKSKTFSNLCQPRVYHSSDLLLANKCSVDLCNWWEMHYLTDAIFVHFKQTLCHLLTAWLSKIFTFTHHHPFTKLNTWVRQTWCACTIQMFTVGQKFFIVEIFPRNPSHCGLKKLHLQHVWQLSSRIASQTTLLTDSGRCGLTCLM